MDDRTKSEFAEDIRQFTAVEMHLGNALRMDFNERGLKCSQHEYGVDNSGELILGKLENFNPDKIFNFEDGTEQKIEIKSLPEFCWDYFTFKESALKGCIHHEAKILVARKEDYFLILPEAHKWMLENLEVKTNYKGWGGKRCVRIKMGAVYSLVRSGSIIQRDWMPGALLYVEENGDIIFEERRTARKEYIPA
jgi:hypothetical protein